MFAPVHECFMALLNEWTHFGNVVLPRDTMLSLAEEAAKAAEKSSGGIPSFAMSWKYGASGFSAVKDQYEKMLCIVPEPHLSQWKEKMGIDDAGLSTLSAPGDKEKDEFKTMPESKDEANEEMKAASNDEKKEASKGVEPMDIDKADKT